MPQAPETLTLPRTQESAAQIGWYIVPVGAHPDDIEVGMGYRIRRKRPKRIGAIVATDGKASTVNNFKDRDPGYVQRGARRLESEAGLSILGIDRSRQFYAELNDGSLREAKRELTIYIATTAMYLGAREFITFDRYGLGHRDHQAIYEGTMDAALLLYRACDRESQEVAEDRQRGQNYESAYREAMLARGAHLICVHALSSEEGDGEPYLATPELEQEKLHASSQHRSQRNDRFIDGRWVVDQAWAAEHPDYARLITVGEFYRREIPQEVQNFQAELAA